MAVHWIKKERDASEEGRRKRALRKYEARNAVCPKEALPHDKMWLLNIPAHLRASAAISATASFATNLAKMKAQKKGFEFDVAYRTKKGEQAAYDVEKKAVCVKNDRVMFWERCWKRVLPGDTGIKMVNMKIAFVDGAKRRVNVIPEISQDCKIKRDLSGRWFIIVPVQVTASEAQAHPKLDVISIDPGQRTFLTTYSPEGESWKFGDGTKRKMETIQRKISSIEERLKGVNDRRRKHKLRRARTRLIQRIGDMVDDMHRKVANVLCASTNVILLPQLHTKRIVEDHTLSPQDKRHLSRLGHYKFRTRLQHKAELAGVLVLNPTEEFTTKTCSACGTLKNVGAAEIYMCDSCGFVCDRDVNAARNILLKTASSFEGLNEN